MQTERVDHETQGESPERTCVGCGKRAPDGTLVRLVLAELGERVTVVPDPKGGSFGRGAHVHSSPSCIEAACKRGLSRAFKREVRKDAAELSAEIRAGYERRLAGLLSGGVRAGLIEIGTDAVIEALRAGVARKVVVAGDAAAAAAREEVRTAIREGRSIAYGDRMRLGAALGRTGDRAREGVAVCAVTNEALAQEIERAWLCMSGTGLGETSRENAG